MIDGDLFGGEMFGGWANHLWQSTVFVAGAALLALALRRNRAQVRYWVWLAASAKFLIPFSALAGIGGALWESLAARRIATEIAAPAAAATIEQVSEPFRGSFSQVIPAATSAPHAAHWMPIAILAAWAFGFAAVALMRIRGWLRVRAMLRASVPVDLGASLATAMPMSMDVRSCAGLLEPGVVGFWRPVLLLPEGIAESLTPEQLEAVLAHELSHIRRRDNLTALIQMIAEAVFWFYPVVWWIGARLVEERERACDEAVLSIGNAPRDYADAILNVCKMYVESPVQCVAGISGADLKRRVVRIMRRSLGEKLTLGRKLLLGAAVLAAITAPVIFGLATAQQDAASPNEAEQVAQEAAQFGPEMKYDVVSIRANKPVPAAPVANPNWTGPRTIRSPFLPDGLTFRNTSLATLFIFAYPGVEDHLILGEPDWWTSEKYDVLAKMDGAVAEKLQKLTPIQQRLARLWMMQQLLADRFGLKVHWETRQLPRYALVVAKGGPKFKEAPASEAYRYLVGVDGKPTPSTGNCYGDWLGQAEFKDINMTHLAHCLEGEGLRRQVVDETGLTGHYDFKLSWDPSRDESDQAGDTSASASPAGAGNGPAFAASTPSGFPGLRKALRQQVGLELRDDVGPVRVLVIDHVEKPTTESEETSPSAPQGASPTTSQNQDAQPTAQATTAAPQNAGSPQSAAAPAPTREAPKFGPEFKYDVASIKPGDPNAPGASTGYPPDGMIANGLSVLSLIHLAYGINEDNRVAGATGWLESERYDIAAKMDEAVINELKNLSSDDGKLARQQMLQELLAERFGLRVHHEAREMPVYDLVVAKGGPKLKASAAPPMAAPGSSGSQPTNVPPTLLSSGSGQPTLPPGFRGTLVSNGQMTAGAMKMSDLASWLSNYLKRDVVDKTGLTGEYDFTLQWVPRNGAVASNKGGMVNHGSAAMVLPLPNAPGGSIAAALQEQLGLKFESSKAMLDVLVIDHVEKPTEN